MNDQSDMMSSSSSTLPSSNFSKTLLTSDNKGMKTEMGKFTLMPEDLVCNILSRLSVKDVLRSRPVCKEWDLLSRTGRFISLHSNRSSQKRSVNGDGFCSSSFILLRSVYDNESEEDDDLSLLEAYKTIYSDQMSLDRNSNVLLTFITLEKTRSGEIQCIEKEEEVNLESLFPWDAGLPLPSDNESIQVCSPFDGLICLAYGSQISLYNPATREVLRLPSPPPPKSEFEVVQSRVLCVWFESESIAKHYKVFRMVCSRVAYMVQVYDSIEDTWSVIMNITGRAYPWISVLFNGVVHFYTEGENDGYVERACLVTIDVKSKEIGRIELPFISLHYNESALLPFCGKLAFLQPSKEDGDDNVFVNIWVMSTEYDDDEEEEDAWTLQYRILVDDLDLDDETTGHTYGTFLYYPLAFWNCMQDENEEGGIELLVRNYLGRIVSCNLVSEEIRDLNLSCIPSCTAMIVPNNNELLLSLSTRL